MFPRHVFEFLSLSGHSESIYFEIDKEDITVEDIRQHYWQMHQELSFKMIRHTILSNASFCRRTRMMYLLDVLRKDPDHPAGFHMWVVDG